MQVRIEGQLVKYVDEVFEGETVEECVRAAKDKHQTLEVMAINDRDVTGFCETCDAPLYADDTTWFDDGDVFYCADCWQEYVDTLLTGEEA